MMACFIIADSADARLYYSDTGTYSSSCMSGTETHDQSCFYVDADPYREIPHDWIEDDEPWFRMPPKEIKPTKSAVVKKSFTTIKQPDSKAGFKKGQRR